MAKSDYDAAVAAFVRNKGVTRCPTACLAPAQASVSAADRACRQIRAAEHQARRRERQNKKCRRLFGPIAAEARAS